MIAAKQLDELECKAKSVVDDDMRRGVARHSWHESEHIAEALYDFYAHDLPASVAEKHAAHIEATTPDVTLQLVAIARAALAWADDRLAQDAPLDDEECALIAALRGER